MNAAVANDKRLTPLVWALLALWLAWLGCVAAMGMSDWGRAKLAPPEHAVSGARQEP